MDNWYVLHVLTGKEVDVRGRLQKEGFKCLVPRRMMREQKDGIWKDVEKLMFPGYVFVSTEMADANYYKLTGLNGVINILRGASPSPTPVSCEEMEVVFRLTQDSDLVGISEILIEGDKIEVISGPLKGLEGLIAKVDKRRFRAKVKVALAGQEKTVELGVNAISKIV